MPLTTVLPTSGAVLGALVKDLRLHLQPDEIQRSSRAYLNGSRDVIKDETRAAIIVAIAQALVQQKYIAGFGAASAHTAESDTKLVATVIDVWAHHWDTVVGGIESQSIGRVTPDVVALSCLRLVVVELAVRVAALMRLTRGRPPDCRCGYCTGAGIPVPAWAENSGQKLLLRSLMARLGLKSLDEFAEKIDASDKTVDEWFRERDPSRPSEDAMDMVATAVARTGKGVDRADLIVSLRWSFAMTAVADRLETILGRERVRNLAWAFARLRASAEEFFRRVVKLSEPEFRERMLQTVMVGSRAPLASRVMNTLATNEPDPSWIAAVRATEKDWGVSIQAAIQVEQSKWRVANVLVTEDGVPPATAALLAEIVTTHQVPLCAPNLEPTRALTADALVLLSVQATRQGDLEAAAVYLRGAVDWDPARPELRQDLGGTLGKLGRFDEALVECRKAVELRPGWSPPLVQLGIILLDAGRNDEALVHLESIAATIEWSVVYGHSLGLALMRARRFDDAITSFERVLEQDPRHAFALDAAGHCYLMRKQWQRGRELAKLAHALGQHETWQALEAGLYHRHKGPDNLS